MELIPENIKQISGPMSIRILSTEGTETEGTEGGRKFILFGDHHYRDLKEYGCEDCYDSTCLGQDGKIILSELITIMAAETNDIVDFYVEIPYRHVKDRKDLRRTTKIDDSMNKIIDKYIECYRNLVCDKPDNLHLQMGDYRQSIGSVFRFLNIFRFSRRELVPYYDLPLRESVHLLSDKKIFKWFDEYFPSFEFFSEYVYKLFNGRRVIRQITKSEEGTEGKFIYDYIMNLVDKELEKLHEITLPNVLELFESIESTYMYPDSFNSKEPEETEESETHEMTLREFLTLYIKICHSIFTIFQYLMDIYLLSRAFSQQQKYVIIYAGESHIELYEDILLSLNFKEEYKYVIQDKSCVVLI